MEHEERERRIDRILRRMRGVQFCDLIPDMTPGEIHLLGAIVEHESEDRKISELSDQVGMQPAGVSRLMNSLEDKGLIQRQSRAGNRRVTEVHPTERGREINARNKRIFHDYWETVYANISAEDTERLFEIWEELLTSMEQVLQEKKKDQKEQTT